MVFAGIGAASLGRASGEGMIEDIGTALSAGGVTTCFGFGVSGAGWIASGRTRFGCALMAVRGVACMVFFIAVLSALLHFDGCDAACARSEHRWFIAAVPAAAIVFAVPLISPIVLAVTRITEPPEED